MKHACMRWMLVGLSVVGAVSLRANPFTLFMDHVQLYHTDFSAATDWDLSANSFISHAHAPAFRPPAGGTISGGVLALAANGSGVLDLTSGSVLGQGLTVGSGDEFAIYGRVVLDTATASQNASVIFALGNDEAFAVSPVSANVVVASGYLRRQTNNSRLASWGWKNDFNNPYDNPYPGMQNTTVPDMPSSSVTEFDFALLFDGATIRAYTKGTGDTIWNSLGGTAVPDTAPGFTSQKLAIYNPNSGNATVTDLTISMVPEAGTVGLFLVGGGLLLLWRRRSRGE